MELRTACKEPMCKGDKIILTIRKELKEYKLPTEVSSAGLNDCFSKLMDYEMRHCKLKMCTVQVWEKFSKNWRKAMPDLKVSLAIPVYTGSVAEGMPNSEDLDTLYVGKWLKLYPETEPLKDEPEMLPYTWNETIPGYIRVIVPPLTRYKYNFLDYQVTKQGRHHYLSSSGFIRTMQEWGTVGSELNAQGPALKGEGVEDSTYDIVHAVQLVSWPPHAMDIFNRVISRRDKTAFLNLNMYAVATGHRLSQDSDLEWRLSFTEAEKLITSKWQGIQRQCYYLLKQFYMIYLEHTDTLCSYFLKTLIFWLEDALQESYWGSQMNLTDSFVRALTLLQYFLKVKCIPNYFIPDNNMISHKDPAEITAIYELIQSLLSSKAMNIVMAELLCEDDMPFVFTAAGMPSTLRYVPVRACRDFCKGLWKYFVTLSDPKDFIVHNEADLLSSLAVNSAIWYKEQCKVMEDIVASLDDFIPSLIVPAFKTILNRLIADFYQAQKTREAKKKAQRLYETSLNLIYPSGFDDRKISGTIQMAFFIYLEGNDYHYSYKLLDFLRDYKTTGTTDQYLLVSLPVWQSSRFLKDTILYDIVSITKKEFPFIINVIILGIYVCIRCKLQVAERCEFVKEEILSLMVQLILTGHTIETPASVRGFNTVFKPLRQLVLTALMLQENEIPNVTLVEPLTRNQKLKRSWSSTKE